MKRMSRYRGWLILCVFLVILIACILYACLGMGVFPVLGIGLMLVQMLLAVVLRGAELWFHILLLAAELAAGAAAGEQALIFLAYIVYIAATMTMQLLMEKGKK